MDKILNTEDIIGEIYIPYQDKAPKLNNLQRTRLSQINKQNYNQYEILKSDYKSIIENDFIFSSKNLRKYIYQEEYFDLFLILKMKNIRNIINNLYVDIEFDTITCFSEDENINLNMNINETIENKRTSLFLCSQVKKEGEFSLFRKFDNDENDFSISDMYYISNSTMKNKKEISIYLIEDMNDICLFHIKSIVSLPFYSFQSEWKLMKVSLKRECIEENCHEAKNLLENMYITGKNDLNIMEDIVLKSFYKEIYILNPIKIYNFKQIYQKGLENQDNKRRKTCLFTFKIKNNMKTVNNPDYEDKQVKKYRFFYDEDVLSESVYESVSLSDISNHKERYSKSNIYLNDNNHTISYSSYISQIVSIYDVSPKIEDSYINSILISNSLHLVKKEEIPKNPFQLSSFSDFPVEISTEEEVNIVFKIDGAFHIKDFTSVSIKENETSSYSISRSSLLNSGRPGSYYVKKDFIENFFIGKEKISKGNQKNEDESNNRLDSISMFSDKRSIYKSMFEYEKVKEDNVTSYFNENDEKKINSNAKETNELKSISEILAEKRSSLKSGVEINLVTPLIISISINESILIMTVFIQWKKYVCNSFVDIVSYNVPKDIVLNKKFPYIIKVNNQLNKNMIVRVEIKLYKDQCQNEFSKKDFLCEELSSNLEIKSNHEKEIVVWLYPIKIGFSTLPTVIIRGGIDNNEEIRIQNGDVYVNSNR